MKKIPYVVSLVANLHLPVKLINQNLMALNGQSLGIIINVATMAYGLRGMQCPYGQLITHSTGHNKVHINRYFHTKRLN